MFKKAQILALGTALTLLMPQTALADVLISPLDPSNVANESGTARNQWVSQNNQSGPTEPGQQSEPGQQANFDGSFAQEIGPGFDSEPQTQVQNSYVPADLPAVPEVAAQAAILYDATNDRVLFEKNADTKLYPASITKLMTAMLVLENTNMDDMVTYSKTATTNLESGAVTLSLTEGDKVSVRDSLYGLMLRSANEVANGLAEHVAGSVSAFADMMNSRAAALGCTNTHFVNPNGLNDPNHYTTCRDMAKIAKAAYANETLCKINATLSYTFPATKNAAARTISLGHKMLYPTDSRYYEGVVAGKTGYTSLAGNTLVTCVEKNGVRLIAVVLKATSTHYEDTKAMLDYGYEVCAAGQNALVGTQAGTMSGEPGSGGPGAYQQNTAQENTALANTVQTGWVLDGETWYYVFADGTCAANGVLTVNGEDYAFDSQGRMLTGWQSLADTWYFFKESGAMAKNSWQQDAGLWFYLGSDGRMVKDAWIDNQYYVGIDGVWVQV